MAKRICSIDDCEKVALARGLCSAHYQRWWATGDPEPKNVFTECAWCGSDLDGSHPLRQYCSNRCRGRADHSRRAGLVSERRKAETRRVLGSTVKQCKQCDEEFTPARSMAQQFCSKKCGRKFHRDNAPRECSVGGCDRPLRAKGLCHAHYRSAARESGSVKPEAWTDRRRANYHRRRALKKNLPAESFLPQEIFNRDGWVCGICAGAVEEGLAWPHPKSPSLDHVVPLSRGGHHTRDNVQLAHLSCNVRKGAGEMVSA